jgi:hypothetical protein
MSVVFKGQSYLRITAKTFVDLSDAVSCVIKYRKPDGCTGSFTAAVSDVSGGAVFHECPGGELDMSGWWVFWAFIEFADGRSACGEAARVFVREEGK